MKSFFRGFFRRFIAGLRQQRDMLARYIAGMPLPAALL